ncbi:MAG: LysR family transcriptional regulator [Rhodobacteraceae bacterium]|nr:LysR family transcriptional regulator [Paracoccaceae bacterium]
MKERQLEAFRAVMTYGGVGRAAEVLNITQPAVSRLISSLEQDVGFALFERAGRGLAPTPEAELFKREIDTFFMGIDRVRTAAVAIRESRRAQLRMTVMPAVALSVGPQIVEAILSRYPTAEIALDVHTAPRIADLVGAGQYDLGISHHDRPRADIEELGHWFMECVCVMARDHPLAGKARLTPKDFAGQPVVLLSYQTSTAQKIEQMFVAANVRPQIRVEAQPSYAAFALAARGLGIAIIDKSTACTLASDAVAILPLHPEISFDIKLIRPTGQRPAMLAAHSAEIAREMLTQEFHNKTA